MLKYMSSNDPAIPAEKNLNWPALVQYYSSEFHQAAVVRKKDGDNNKVHAQGSLQVHVRSIKNKTRSKDVLGGNLELKEQLRLGSRTYGLKLIESSI